MKKNDFLVRAERWITTNEIPYKEQQARMYAIAAHKRVNSVYDGREYAYHLAHARDVAERFKHLIPEEYWIDICCGIWVHDLPEDTKESYNKIKRNLGVQVAEYAYACELPKGRTREDKHCKAYYDEMLTIPRATYVKLADRVANAEYNRFYLGPDSKNKLPLYQSELHHFARLVDNLTGDATYQPMFEYLKEILEG